MPLNPDTVLNWKVRDAVHDYTWKDTILYALGIGAGQDPSDQDELRYVYEKELVAFPSLPMVLCHPGQWMEDPACTITRSKIVFGEIRLDLHGPVPVAGRLIGRTRVVGLVDKGADKGAIIHQVREISDPADNRPVATVHSATFARADGGFGGDNTAINPLDPVPDRQPDLVLRAQTFPMQALIYRLSGDVNPLHIDPAVAVRAGYDRPILHGLATFGTALRAILKHLGPAKAGALKTMQTRFSGPVIPGDALEIRVWTLAEGVAFDASVPARGSKALSHGRLAFG